MRERARAVGGTLLVEAAPGSGTRVAAEAPRVANDGTWDAPCSIVCRMIWTSGSTLRAFSAGTCLVRAPWQPDQGFAPRAPGPAIPAPRTRSDVVARPLL